MLLSFVFVGIIYRGEARANMTDASRFRKEGPAASQYGDRLVIRIYRTDY